MKKIFLLTIALLGAVRLSAQQPTTMITKLTNGAVVRTDVSDVERITFADTVYHLNSTGYRILEADELCWPDDRLLPHFLPPASPVKALDLSAAKLSDEERVMFCTLQGIVNRTRPRILLYNHNEEARTLWPNAHSLRTSAVSSSAPYSLVQSFQEEIDGLVLYSNDLSTQPCRHHCRAQAPAPRDCRHQGQARRQRHGLPRSGRPHSAHDDHRRSHLPVPLR